MNGDLVAGLAGWVVEGREDPVALVPPPGVRLKGNVTLVSPPLPIPVRAQAVAITARVPGGRGLLGVRARPEGGGPEVELATLEPGPATRRFIVPAAPVAGRAVRIVLDPVPGLGSAMDVLGVGPVTVQLPSWRVVSGVPEVRGSGAGRLIRVEEAALALRSPLIRLSSRTRAVTVAIRGTGTVRLRIAGRTSATRAGTRWRLLRVAIPRPPRRPVRLLVTAAPGAEPLELRALGRLRTAGRSGAGAPR